MGYAGPNYVRTLLLNLQAEPVGATPGEEYVPADFRPAALPAELQRAALTVFGPGADRAGKNLQLARLLTYLHASPLAQYVTESDTRLTYRLPAVANVFDQLGATVAALGSTAAVGWVGSATFPAVGRAYGLWTVTTNGSGGYTVAGPDGLPQTGGVAVQPGGDAVPLFGSSLSLLVPAGAADRWRVSLLVAPAHNFTAAASSGDPAAVFRSARGASEAAWYEAYSESPAVATRAAAFALALAARTADVLNGIPYASTLPHGG